MVAVNRHDPL
jgi:uncharacterized protein (DUF433 family)